jgi:hypothetical protein
MIAEGVARAIDHDPPETAFSILDRAAEFVAVRNAEVARGWFLKAGMIGSAVSAVLAQRF